MKHLLLLLALPLLIACSDAALQTELAATQTELAKAQETIVSLQSQLEADGKLVHLVLFNLKPDADRAAFVAEVEKLKVIEEIQEMEMGFFEHLDDARALSDYACIMELSFANKEAYTAYQQHPVHINLKEKAGPYFAGPPATYDFMKQ